MVLGRLKRLSTPQGHLVRYACSYGLNFTLSLAVFHHADTSSLSPLFQIHLICFHLRPYIPALLLDQFGNYVVQCCLGLGPDLNQFIFDAVVEKCWEIAQGRFGARAMRATLESPHVTKRQQVK